MATVGSYQTKAGRRWRARYRTPDGRRTDKRGFTTKREAQLFVAAVEVERAAGDFVSASAGRVSVAAMAPHWLTRKQASSAPSHYRTLESAWRTHVLPQWGSRHLVDITTLEVETWIAQLQTAGCGSTTVRRAHGVLKGVLDDAVKDRRLHSNPASGVDDLPRRSERRHVYLTASDVHRLAEQAGRHRALVLVLAFCGLRWGEAIALRVADVDFLRRRITVCSSAVQLGATHVVGPTKGRKSRSVPVPGFVVEELARRCEGKDRDDLIFGHRDGGFPARPRSGNGWFAAAAHRAGLPTITPHDLRHTCASLAVSAGVHVLALQRMLGHRSAKVTLDVYADLFDSDLDAVATGLDAAYAPRSVGTVWSREVPRVQFAGAELGECGPGGPRQEVM